MDNELDTIHDSHKKITNFINNGLKKEDAIVKYLSDLTFPPIKDFKEGLEWFNVSEPLTFSKHLKGKLVLFDFFTYCCINCMHILPDLKDLENEFSIEDGFVVIGVHSAKFSNEKQSHNILSAVQRYNISHPVVNDNVSDMWRKCDVHCWPTLLLIGPDARPLIMLMGEGHKQKLQLYISNALKYYISKGLISCHSLPSEAAYHLLPATKGPLLFPGKIAIHKNLMAISDCGNHRLLLVSISSGEIIDHVGKKIGFRDGDYDICEFNSPQGVCFSSDGGTLFVADTENHAVRAVDLKTRNVRTVAGTGQQGEDHKGGNIGRKQVISSPWDVAVYIYEQQEILFIAMAGTHQVWALFPDISPPIRWWKGATYPSNTCLCVAGNGREENRNNQYPHNAAFAQPSGLAINNNSLYIADSESSTVRKLIVGGTEAGRVMAVVGGDRDPNNLFAFGDRDGTTHDAKLQHALGVAMHSDGSTLFVADTYNHKIKLINTNTNTIAAMQPFGSLDPKTLVFNEPAGLAIMKNTLFIADTNNHCIKIVELINDNDKLSAKSIKTMEFKDKFVNDRDTVDKMDIDIIKCIDRVHIAEAGGKVVLKIAFIFEDGLKLTEKVPQSWEVNLANLMWSSTPTSGKDVNLVDILVSVPPKTSHGDHQDYCYINVEFNIITCTEESCFPKKFIVRKCVQFDKGASNYANESIKIKLSPNTATEDK